MDSFISRTWSYVFKFRRSRSTTISNHLFSIGFITISDRHVPTILFILMLLALTLPIYAIIFGTSILIICGKTLILK